MHAEERRFDRCDVKRPETVHLAINRLLVILVIYCQVKLQPELFLVA